MLNRIRVWDLPTRVFHWLLVFCCAGSLLSAEIGGDAMVWHFRFGYGILSLLLFRLVWGLVGGYWSRFTSFVRTPLRVWRYMTESPVRVPWVGHNPLGALSVLAMLCFLFLQVATGLVSDDEIIAAGPLTAMVSERWVRLASWYHSEIGKVVLIILIQLHIAAIVFYKVKHQENLVRPMLDGDQLHHADVPQSRDDTRSRLKALAIFILCAACVGAMVQWAT